MNIIIDKSDEKLSEIFSKTVDFLKVLSNPDTLIFKKIEEKQIEISCYYKEPEDEKKFVNVNYLICLK